MRRSKLTDADVLKAEQAKDDRKHSRLKGFAKMRERDAGRVRLSNGVFMLWPVPDDGATGEIELDRCTVEVTTYPPSVPEGKFILELDGRKWLFDAEEFRRHLRWV
jgi:hypothetical protein